jgi:hypothetical protein
MKNEQNDSHLRCGVSARPNASVRAALHLLASEDFSH